VGAVERGLQALHATVCIVLVILDPGQTFIGRFALNWGVRAKKSGKYAGLRLFSTLVA
jgi:hypothetical protein